MNGSYNVRLHVGVDPHATVAGVHAVADTVEAKIREVNGHIASIVVHTEPLETVQVFDKIEEVKSFITTSSSLLLRNVTVEVMGDVQYVNISCVAQGSAQLSEIHDAVTLLEDKVKELFGGDVYMTIHMEPVTTLSPA